MKHKVIEAIQYPKNFHQETIATFVQPAEAVKFAKQQAKQRMKYDNKTPFEYAVIFGGEGIKQRFFNTKELIT